LTARGRAAAPYLLIALCALFLHRDGLLGGAAFYELDTQLFYYPLAHWVGDQLRGGSYPLWLPGIFTGYPIFADGELGLAYVPQILLLWALPTPLAMVWLRVLHAFLAGAFTLWFLRALRLEPVPALGGALVFAFGSFLTAQMHHENVIRSAVWLPAALACLYRAMNASRRPRFLLWTAVGALAFAQAALGVHVQPVLMTILAVGGFALFSAAVGPSRLCPFVAAGAIGVGGLGIAAVQWLPLGEWALVSARRGGVTYEFGSAFGIAPENLPTILFPYFFRLPDAATWWTLWQPWETELYVGIPTLALILVGIVFGRRREILYFVTLGGVSLLIAMAHYAPMNLHFLLWSVPGFSFLRAPGRFSYLVVFACACLAALGLQALQARRGRLVVALAGALPMVGLLAALLALLPTWRNSLLADPRRALESVQSTYLATRAQYPIDPSLVVSGMLSSLDFNSPKTLWALALLALTAIGFVVWLGLGARRAALGQSVLVGLIACDLLVFAADFHPRTALASLQPTLPGGVAPGQRVLLYGPTDLPAYEPNQLMVGEVSSVDGYSSLPSQRHSEVQQATLTQPALFDLWGEQVVLEPTAPADLHERNGVRFRAEHPLMAGFGGSPPSILRVPSDLGPIVTIRLVGTLSYAFAVAQGTTVATLEVDGQAHPLRAGIELSERAYERPSLQGLLRHQRTAIAFDFEEATPEGEAYVGHLYQAEIALSPPLSASTLTFAASDPSVLVELHGVALVGANGTRSLDIASRQGLQRLGPNAIQNTNALPRAFVLPRGQAFSPARHPGLTATQLVTSPDMDLHRQVLIEGDPDAPATPGPGSREAQAARLVDIGPNIVQVIATPDVPSYLVVTDFYHRGWTAYVDGRPSRVLIADALFRAVAIEPGQHVVELRFEPLSHLVGAVATLFTVLLDLGLILYGLRLRHA
jgi:hypothetical protein